MNTPRTGLPAGHWALVGWALYLCLAQMGLLLAWLASRRVVGHEGQTPARRLLAGWWRRLGRLRPRAGPGPGRRPAR